MLPRSALCLCSLLLASACGGHPSNSSTTHVATTSEAPRFYEVHDTAPTGYFEPSAADVTSFEARLAAHLSSNRNPEAARIASRLSEYRRQFVGVQIAGQRLVFGNFFRSDDPVDQPLAVSDGGNRFFQIYYDATTQSYSRFSINGHA